jgi:hypothetical protein
MPKKMNERMYECLELSKLDVFHISNKKNIPFRTITQGKNKLQQQDGQVHIFDDSVNDRGGLVTKGETLVAV